MKNHKLACAALLVWCSHCVAAGTTTTVLHGSTTGNGVYGKVVQTTDIAGVTPLVNGGTGNTTGTATINANLTGPITSIGNASAIAAQTGTGSVIVTDTSPTLITPTLGAATATSINFGQTALAFYQQGTWTPAVTFATPGDISVAYTTQVGSYTRVGNRVTASFNIVTSTFTFTTASGVLQITGIPFTSESTTNNTSTGALNFGGITKATYTGMTVSSPAGQSFFTVLASGSAVAPSTVVAADTPTGGTITLRGTITYQVP